MVSWSRALDADRGAERWAVPELTVRAREALPDVAAKPPGRIARSTFTNDVVDREPVDSLDSLWNYHPRVFFFTELHGMEGQTVTGAGAGGSTLSGC